VRVERPRAPLRAEAPDVTEQLLLAEDAVGLLGERDEELVLLRRELDRAARDPDRAQ